jgi:hypothetical protein
MEQIVYPVLDAADGARAFFLRNLTSIPALRFVFTNRIVRLQILFLVTCLAYLFLSQVFPLWVLLTGPIVYGVPHIFASIRYAHRGLNEQSAPERRTPALRSLTWVASIWIGVLGMRLLTDFSQLELPWYLAYTNLIEIVASVFTIGIGLALYRRSPVQALIAFSLFSPLAIASYYAPGETLGFLILFHNLIAFAYWAHSAKNSEEKKSVLFATLVFIFANVLIFMGFLDRSLDLFPPSMSLFDGAIDAQQIGRMIVPWSKDAALQFHCVVAYAFGQALHYFIWLKAIPDQAHDRQTPTTFRQSFHLIRSEYGKSALIAIIATCLVGAGIWLFMELQTARQVYFCIAAYHGYLEMALLTIIIAGARRKPARV